MDRRGVSPLLQVEFRIFDRLASQGDRLDIRELSTGRRDSLEGDRLAPRLGDLDIRKGRLDELIALAGDADRFAGERPLRAEETLVDDVGIGDVRGDAQPDLDGIACGQADVQNRFERPISEIAVPFDHFARVGPAVDAGRVDVEPLTVRNAIRGESGDGDLRRLLKDSAHREQHEAGTHGLSLLSDGPVGLSCA